MKYQVGLICIMITFKIATIDLSGLLSDSNQVVTTTHQAQSQPSLSTQEPAQRSTSDSSVTTTESQTNQAQQNVGTPKMSPINLSGLSIFSDPDYQKAMNILNNQQNSRIYDDYLESIRRYFIDYYLVHVQPLKKIVKKPKVINLSALETLSSSTVVQKKSQRLPEANLSSLVDIGNIKVTKIPIDKKAINLGLLADSTNIQLTKIAEPKAQIINLSGLESAQPVQVMAAPEPQPLNPQSTTQKKKRRINLSSLLNN
jgi:hypothetical protein